LDYADIRDQRQELNAKEVELKSKLISLMHKHKLENYEHDGVTIRLEVEEETVKVRVRPVEEEKTEEGDAA
jgi:hypothetical protein